MSYCASSSVSPKNEHRIAHLTGEQSGTGTEGARQNEPGWSLSDCQLLRGCQAEACWDNHDCASHSQHDHPHGLLWINVSIKWCCEVAEVSWWLSSWQSFWERRALTSMQVPLTRARMGATLRTGCAGTRWAVAAGSLQSHIQRHLRSPQVRITAQINRH